MAPRKRTWAEFAYLHPVHTSLLIAALAGGAVKDQLGAWLEGHIGMAIRAFFTPPITLDQKEDRNFLIASCVYFFIVVLLIANAQTTHAWKDYVLQHICKNELQRTVFRIFLRLFEDEFIFYTLRYSFIFLVVYLLPPAVTKKLVPSSAVHWITSKFDANAMFVMFSVTSLISLAVTKLRLVLLPRWSFARKAITYIVSVLGRSPYIRHERPYHTIRSTLFHPVFALLFPARCVVVVQYRASVYEPSAFGRGRLSSGHSVGSVSEVCIRAHRHWIYRCGFFR
jgi:hypothetical protein